MKNKLQYPKEYEIKGLKVIGYSKDNIKCINCDGGEFIKYRTLFCIISVAKDSMGIQICHNGRFFDNMSFNYFDSAVRYLKINKERAIKVYRKVFFQELLQRMLNPLDRWWWRSLYRKFKHIFSA